MAGVEAGPPRRHCVKLYDVRSFAAVVTLFLSFVATAGAAEPVRPPLIRYIIDARYDAARHVIHGEQTMIWRNHSDVALESMPLHLYLNAFRSGSTFLQESEETLDAEEQGSIELETLLIDGVDALPSLRYIAPDDGNRADRTLAEIQLPRPLSPGESITVETRFESRLPMVYARTGWSDDFVFAGQWYPKPAVLETAGTRNRAATGFTPHQFHADSEFYAEFADYDVTLDTPAEWILGATGRRTTNAVTGERRKTRWLAHNVHDFAWSASPDFIERVYRFSPARDVPGPWRTSAATLLGVSAGSLEILPVEVTLLMQPDNEGMAERYRDAVFATLAWAGLRLGPYRWRHLTVIDPPPGALEAGGMEYPMLVTALTHPVQSMWPLASMSRLPEVVVAHEVAHQWFYGMIATNEFEEPWLDEGLTTWLESEILDAMQVQGVFRLPPLPAMTPESLNRLGFLQADEQNIDPIVRNAWQFAPDAYGYNSYQRAGLAVLQIEGVVGEAKFAQAMRAYAERFAFRHPATDDFLSTVQQVAGVDLTEIRNGVFHGDAGFDHLIDTPRSRREGDVWKARFTIIRSGELGIGAPVRLYYSNGQHRDLSFPARARLVRWSVSSRSPIQRIVIDPERVNMLESDATNNVHVFEDARSWRLGAALKGVALVSHIVRMMVMGW